MIRLDLSWVPDRVALINGSMVKYDVGVKEDHVELADQRLSGFTKIGLGRIYSVDGFLVSVDQSDTPSMFYQAPDGMTSAECNDIVDALFNEIDSLSEVKI